MAITGTLRSTRTTSGKFRMDFALLTNRCSYYNVLYRYSNAEDQVHRRLGTKSDVVLDYIDPTVLPGELGNYLVG
jgi:hypothetical protein